MQQKKRKNLSDNEKEDIDVYPVKLVKALNKKEKYQYYNHDDLDYYGIKDIENLLILMMIMTNQY